MTPERWQAVGSLFHQALDVEEDHRDSWIANVCGVDEELRREVFSLLSSHVKAQEGFVQAQVKDAVISFTGSGTHPSRVGPYRILREIGSGGMGTVYLAERDDEHYRSKVAIKLVRAGMDTEFVLARFRRERQTLASLQHPNIARLLDGGATETGLPYIAMEFVDGARITEYARARNLSVAARIELFLPVCFAVAYAHRNFVVHRDIKPGNILIDVEGVPKLLDFGIAKPLYTELASTEDTTSRMLTPDYASPEQVRGEPVTVTSDVYSLGAVLYELLSGARPHRILKNTPQAIERAICEAEIVAPSAACGDPALARRLRGDLDNIVLRALEKEPLRRYDSPYQFAADLRRHLAHEPVRARPQTFLYRALKFARRHLIPIAATAAVIIALTTGATLYRHEAIVAQRRLLQIRSLANKFVFDVHDAVKDLPGSMAARRLIAQTGVDYLDALSRDARGDTQFEKELANAYLRIGDVQGNIVESNLGNTPAALNSFSKALALLDDVDRRRPGDPGAQAAKISIHLRIGNIERMQRSTTEALRTFNRGIEIGFAIQSPGADVLAELASLYINRAELRREMGDMAESLADSQSGLALYKRVEAATGGTAATRRNEAAALGSIAASESRLGKLSDAVAHARMEVADMEEAMRLDPKKLSYRRDLLRSSIGLADLLGSPDRPSLGDAVAARQVYEKAVVIGREVYQGDSVDQRAAADYGTVLERLATVMPDRDRPTKIAMHREALAVLQAVARVSPEDSSLRMQLASAQVGLGDMLQLADPQGARRSWRECADLSERVAKLGQRGGLVLQVICDGRLAESLAKSGDRRQALMWAQRALDCVRMASRYPATGLTAPRAYAAMGMAFAALSRSKNSEPEDIVHAKDWLEQSLDAWRKVQSAPAFGLNHRKAMQETQSALTALRIR